ncbi:cysteine hydrolase family protein [Kitasatospora camelliae]|uniref:Isochorismatase family cysteine hydrolase n=1 Tax=Kitasatospora camelliae TaxID=3156397 RepID=A0AAU8JVE8_9ACTN
MAGSWHFDRHFAERMPGLVAVQCRLPHAMHEHPSCMSGKSGSRGRAACVRRILARICRGLSCCVTVKSRPRGRPGAGVRCVVAARTVDWQGPVGYVRGGSMSRRPALLILDLINELVHPDGKYAGEGFCEQVARRGVLERAATAIERARLSGIPVVYVVVGFSPGYPDWPRASPLFAEARHGDRVVLGTWGTEVHSALEPADGEPIVEKRRVNPFLGTHLELLLRNLDVNTLLLTGVTTDLVILSTAREGHDRDFAVEVLEDATATSDQDLHDAALKLIARTATVTTVDEALPAPATAGVSG